MQLSRIAEAPHLDEAAFAGVVDLERRVLDSELVVEQSLELAAATVAVLAGSNQNVRRQGGKAGRDRPHVEVVHLDDPGAEASR